MSQSIREMIAEKLCRDGGSAYPVTVEADGTTSWTMGMSMRQAYKMAALQGLMANLDPTVDSSEWMVTLAAQAADLAVAEDEAHGRGES